MEKSIYLYLKGYNLPKNAIIYLKMDKNHFNLIYAFLGTFKKCKLGYFKYK